MKKIINLLIFIFVIMLYHLVNRGSIFLFTLSFSLFLIYYGIFSSSKINDLLSKYHDKKYYYSEYRVVKYVCLFIFIVSLLLGGISYFISLIIDIDGFGIISIVMSMFLCITIIIRFINGYFNILGYRNDILFDIYRLGSIIIDMVIIILLPRIDIMYMYLIPFIVGFILLVLCYVLVFRKNGKVTKKREEVKINYIKDIKRYLIDNRGIVIFNIINSSYIYISIIVLYYVLLNRYHYSYDDVASYISNVYFYGMVFIYYVYLVIRDIYANSMNKLRDIVISKDNDIKYLFHKLFNRVINTTLVITIVFMVISGPICNLLYNGNYNFIFGLMPLLFFYVLYDFIFSISIVCNKEKNVIILLFIGLFTKVLFEIPFINSMYRIGYNLAYGGVVATILGFIVAMIIGSVLVFRKLKISFMDNFSSILNIVYDNIVLCLILVLFTLIVKVTTSGVISSILVILFYVFITVIYFIVKKVLISKK